MGKWLVLVITCAVVSSVDIYKSGIYLKDSKQIASNDAPRLIARAIGFRSQVWEFISGKKNCIIINLFFIT